MSDCRNCIHFTLFESKEGDKKYTIRMSCNVFDDTTHMMTALDCPRFESYLKGDYFQ